MDLSEAACQYESVEEAAVTKLSRISYQICSLRMISIQTDHSSSPCGHFDSKNFLSCALELDNKLADLAATCLSAYCYRTISSEEKSTHLHPKSSHVYNSISAASIWIEYCVTRILVNELLLKYSRQIIRDELESKKIETPSLSLCQLIQKSASITAQLAGDICSSVPFCPGRLSTSGQMPKGKLHPNAIAGNLLIWPLYIAACADVEPEMRDWAVGRLREIAEDMGVKLAKVVAECVACN
jgi:hypothetical protein